MTTIGMTVSLNANPLPFTPEGRANPYPLLHALRATQPVLRGPFGVWILTRYDDVASILRDPRFSSDLSNAAELPFARRGGADLEAWLERRRAVLLFADPPDHTRLRGLVNQAFTPRRVEAMRADVVRIVDDVVDTFPTDGVVEIIGALAYPIPVTVIAELLGIPEEDRASFRAWSRDLAHLLDPFQAPGTDERGSAAIDTFVASLEPLIAERRARPRDDLLSALIAAEERGDQLSGEELIATLLLLLVAGHETTVNLIGNGLLALLRHPGELERLRADPSILSSAVEELLRYDSPVQLTGRTALDTVELGGATIRNGEIVIGVIGAANRDPARFVEPDRLDLTRPDNRHLSFGGGPHFCLGAALARLEAATVFAALAGRFARLALAGEVTWRDTVTLRGLTALPVALRSS